MAADVFQNTEHGVYFMRHVRKEQVKYVGWSNNVHATLLGLIHGLYDKQRSDHSALQVEILCHSPFAKDWSLTAWACKKEDLLLEHAKRVIEYKCLFPCGLNQLVQYRKKEDWEQFCMWYMDTKRSDRVL